MNQQEILTFEHLASFAQKIRDRALSLTLEDRRFNRHRATCITLSGDLGAGKTAWVQAFARELGVPDTLQSPTFVIFKKYPLPEGAAYPWKYFIHGDAYRIEHASEMERLGWDELISNEENLICFEWPEMIQEILPSPRIALTLSHRDEHSRFVHYTLLGDDENTSY